MIQVPIIIAHFNLANVGSEPEEDFEKRTLPIGQAIDDDHLGDQELLTEGNCNYLKAIVDFELGLEIGSRSLRLDNPLFCLHVFDGSLGRLAATSSLASSVSVQIYYGSDPLKTLTVRVRGCAARRKGRIARHRGVALLCLLGVTAQFPGVLK
ncbi:hypothetical protein U1Q18_018067 [Sarracenia purpurea var. burkii]